jgi:hypothetical protein
VNKDTDVRSGARACATVGACLIVLAAPQAAQAGIRSSVSSALQAAPLAAAGYTEGGKGRSKARRGGKLRAGLHGGGHFGRFVHFVSVRLDRSRTSFTAAAALVTDCSPGLGGNLLETLTVDPTPLGSGGRFAGDATFTESLPSGIPGIGGLVRTVTVDFTIQIEARGRAAGAARVRASYRSAQTGAAAGSCDTGTIPWRARIAPAHAGRGRSRPAAGAEYLGTTRQAQPFLLRSSIDGRSVARAGMTFLVRCPSALGGPLDVVAGEMPVLRGGRFGASGSFRRDFTLPDGARVLELYRWRLRGRFGSRGASGTWRVSATVRRPNGERVSSCSTGANRWRARS